MESNSLNSKNDGNEFDLPDDFNYLPVPPPFHIQSSIPVLLISSRHCSATVKVLNLSERSPQILEMGIEMKNLPDAFRCCEARQGI